MNSCDLIQHIGSGEEFVVASNQSPITPFHNEHTVYAWDRAGIRIPLDRRTVRVIHDSSPVTCHPSPVTTLEAA
jgi:hypothetical protein